MDRNLLIRTLSGAVMLAVVLGAVLASPYSMALLFIAVAAGSMLEFYKIARLTGAVPLQVYPTVIGVLLVAVAFAVAAGLIAQRRCYTCCRWCADCLSPNCIAKAQRP